MKGQGKDNHVRLQRFCIVHQWRYVSVSLRCRASTVGHNVWCAILSAMMIGAAIDHLQTRFPIQKSLATRPMGAGWGGERGRGWEGCAVEQPRVLPDSLPLFLSLPPSHPHSALASFFPPSSSNARFAPLSLRCTAAPVSFAFLPLMEYRAPQPHIETRGARRRRGGPSSLSALPSRSGSEGSATTPNEMLFGGINEVEFWRISVAA